MFRPGDLIIYGRTGVCRVEKIEEQGGRQYYCLQALYQTCIIHAFVYIIDRTRNKRDLSSCLLSFFYQNAG